MNKMGNSLASFEFKKLESLGWPGDIIKKTLSNPNDKQIIFKLERVGMEFDGKTLLKDIDLTIKEGEIFGVVGLAGSGKSTLLNILVGLQKPTNGRVLLRLKETGEEIDLYQKKGLTNALIGFSTQTSSFYPDLTVEENIAYFASLYGLSDRLDEVKSAVFSLMQLKDISLAKASSLSKGLQKKLDIACAIVHTPDILVLDDPTADLDPLLCSELWSLIRRINNAGTTIVLASHNLTGIEDVCTRVGIIHKGIIARLVNTNFIGREPYEITATLPHPKHFLKNAPEAAFSGNQAIFKSKKPLQTAGSIIRQLEKMKAETSLVSFNVKKPSLERIFNEVVGL